MGRRRLATALGEDETEGVWSRLMNRRDVVDARFVVITPPRPFRWSSVFWWVVYVGGFVGAAAQTSDPVQIGALIIGASLIVPVGRFVTWTWETLQAGSSEEWPQRPLPHRE